MSLRRLKKYRGICSQCVTPRASSTPYARPGLVNVFASQADVGDAYRFCIGSGALVGVANLAALLRRVVFVGEAALGQRLDLQRITRLSGGM